jgi:hypothetical protein
MRCWSFVILTCVMASQGFAHEPHAVLSGDAVIRGRHGPSDIVITTTSRLAGAIHSLTWNGQEFIDSHDHGRQLQSASSFDAASPTPFWAECFNPTEAGSRADGAGDTSASQLQSLHADGDELQTTTRMAFWLAPGETSSDRPALNDRVLSDHLLSKRVQIGHQHRTNVIDYAVTFTVPAGEGHRYAQFEALTGYMPAEFQRFFTFRPSTGTLEALSDGPGEQQYPVVFATAEGQHAMGIYSPDQPSRGYEAAGYGRFRFPAEQVVKWNCVFRVRDTPIQPGAYHYRLFVILGTLAEVKETMRAITTENVTR